ncbi:hypothetical protein HH738_004783, partial [Escherichia coli]|nr:hypothetical protein [Escherichia coli]
LVILFTSFSGSLVSRIPGAVHCESAKAGAVLIFWHELAINGYTSMNAIKRQEIIDADHQRLRKLIWPEDDWK